MSDYLLRPLTAWQINRVHNPEEAVYQKLIARVCDKDEKCPARQAEVLASQLRTTGVAVGIAIREGVGEGVYRSQVVNEIVADWLDKRFNLRKSEMELW